VRDVVSWTLGGFREAEIIALDGCQVTIQAASRLRRIGDTLPAEG